MTWNINNNSESNTVVQSTNSESNQRVMAVQSLSSNWSLKYPYSETSTENVLTDGTNDQRVIITYDLNGSGGDTEYLELVLDMTGVMNNNVLTFTTTATFINNEQYEFDLDYTGTILPTTSMVIVDASGTTYNINNIIQQNTGTSVTTSEMRQCASIPVQAGSYRWHFTGKIKKVSGVNTVFIKPVVVNPLGFARYYSLFMTSDQMLNAETDGMYGNYSVPDLAVITCSTDNGYQLGHLYQFHIDTTDPDNLVYSWIDISPNVRHVVTDLSSTSITLDNANSNTDYYYGTLTSLSITANDTSNYETNIWFTVGTGMSSVIIPSTLKEMMTIPTLVEGKLFCINILNNTVVYAQEN